MTNLEEQIDRVRWEIGKIIKKHTHELHGVIIFNDDTAIPELAALVRERERAAYYKGFFDKMFDNNMLADENPNKEQPK